VETLAFYSYKGGAGRSLLLANAARYLASLGRGVVALDLDFEAPGLHYKLGRAASRDGWQEGIGGAVPYLVATAGGATSPPPLEEHLVKVPVPPSSEGWLLLMPAGPAPDRTYWATLKQLGDQVRFDDPSGQGLMSLLDLHARIKEELKPDYLLIDARTGVTELGGLATTILADIVVCMFVANQESLDGTLTVAEAVRAAPRLKKQRPVRIVPVLSRTTSAPPGEGPFAAGVERLLSLSEGRETREKKKGTKIFVLPHDEVHGAADRVVGGENTASAFSPLYKSYLELFRELFPSSAQRAQEALGRLEAVASLKEDLTRDRRDRYGFEDLLAPWDESAIVEGVSYESDEYRPRASRYADLVCRDAAGRRLLAVEYVAEALVEEAKAFWEKSTTIRCLVLLWRTQQGGAYRRIYTRRPDETDLRPTDRWDPPRPREFELFPDVGDRSVEAMLDALRHGHREAAAWLVREWLESMAAVAMHKSPKKIPSWRPTRARRILNGLAATEDPKLAEYILRHAASSVPWRERWHESPWRHGGELDQQVTKDLFAPLFWRLPVEAVIKYAEPRRAPDGAPGLAGYRLLAEDLMGLRYGPDRSALDEAQALAVRWGGTDHGDDDEDRESIRWLLRSRREQIERVRLSDEPPTLLLWEELLREDRYWHGTLEEAKEKLSEKARKQVNSTSGLRSRLRDRRDRRELVAEGLLGHYDTAGWLVLYSKAIAAAAELLGVPPRFLKSVVFIHLSARFLAHQARDLDNQPGYGFAPSLPSSPFHRESPTHICLAQCFSHRLIVRLEDPNLMAAFEKLSQHQPEPYRQWNTMREIPLEQLRTLLLRARASASAIGLPGIHE
jgi:hypothetical protein